PRRQPGTEHRAAGSGAEDRRVIATGHRELPPALAMARLVSAPRTGLGLEMAGHAGLARYVWRLIGVRLQHVCAEARPASGDSAPGADCNNCTISLQNGGCVNALLARDCRKSQPPARPDAANCNMP